jgi:hypothetical protein
LPIPSDINRLVNVWFGSEIARADATGFQFEPVLSLADGMNGGPKACSGAQG